VFSSPAEEHRAYAPRALGFAAVTASDSRTVATDHGGRLVREKVEQAGHRFVAGRLVRDEPEALQAAVAELLALPEVDVVVTTGGTGFSPRDVTLEAVSPLFERVVPGFGELFRLLSFQEVGAAAMLSRAMAGVVGQRVVFCLPGSPRAVALALDRLVLPEAAHLLGQLRRRP
jgi:molybdenum cofactor biosynthesis protein B